MKPLLVLSLLSWPAEAARHASFCESAYDIAPRIEVCPDNAQFADAADRCLARLAAEVNATSGVLAAGFAAAPLGAVSAQHAKQTNHHGNLALTDGGLRRLLAQARLARRDLEDYVTTIVLPGNPTLDQLMQHDIFDLLAENGCYRDNRARLEASIASLERKIAELEHADAAANALGTDTASRAHNLGSEARAPASATYAPGAGRVPSGRSPRDASTITGEIRPVVRKAP